jgi:hypothetical protein
MAESMMDRVESGRGSLLDNIQAMLGLYAKGAPGGVSSDAVKKAMKYHGIQSMITARRLRLRCLLRSISRWH